MESTAVPPVEVLDNELRQPPPVRSLPSAESTEAATAPQAAPFWAPLSELSWRGCLLIAWLVIVLGQVVRLLGQRLRLARLLKRAVPVEGELAELVTELGQQIGLRRTPSVVAVAGDCPLFVCGFWRSRLVLPSRLMASLGLAERRQVILHELAHIKRHDLLWGWPVEIARILYFFHPLVYWVAYQLRLERELACDQLAMARSGHTAADYAQTLVQVVSHASEPASLQVAAIAAGLMGNEISPKQPERRTESNPFRRDK
jgi:beta-lactamase regulating signal transducer with metallopeptidase domain